MSQSKKKTSKKTAGKKFAAKKALAKKQVAKKKTSGKKVTRVKIIDQQDAAKKTPVANLDKQALAASGKLAGRKRVSDSNGPAEPGQAKPGQKKRGWRDIEALKERARLKSLLTDIWHEDIDLDSDIFGEFEQVSSYYTDKEEEIEIEDDDDDDWEEFEEDEN